MLVLKTSLTKYCLTAILVMVPWFTNHAASAGESGPATTVRITSKTSTSSDSSLQNDIRVLFPRAFGIAVNQVGYMQGGSLEATDGPWRAGIRRDFDVRDYRPIAEVGKAVGIRFMSLFALAEMDRLNVVARLPYATQAGHAFDNHHNISNRQLEIMDYVKQNAANIEFGVTGVGHEWWEDGMKTRSEWYSLTHKKQRPDSLMLMHMDVIRNILWQYGISEEYGHSFPESFSALGFHWNPAGPFSTGKLFSDAGVKYVTTKFYIIPELNPPPQYSGGFDHGVLVLDREGYGNLWHTYADIPREGPEAYEVDLIESHWANWLAEDDFLQEALNERWIEYFKSIQAYPYRYLAKNTEQLYSQWLYQEHAQVEMTSVNSARVDNRRMPDRAYSTDMLGNMVLSVPLLDGEHLADVRIDGKPVPSILEEAGFGFIYLPRLGKNIYNVSWTIGTTRMTDVVHNKGTYNVYASDMNGSETKFTIKMYGTQDVHFNVGQGTTAHTEHPGFRIIAQRYDVESNELIVTLAGHDIQGETGEIIIRK